MGVLYDPDNVVVGEASGLFAPEGTVLPADTLALFDDWPVGWVRAGGTDEGWKLTGDTNTTDVRIEESQLPIDTNVESRTLGIEAALAEDTLDSMRLSFGGGAITTQVGPPATKTLVLSDDLEVFMGALEFKTAGGLFRRIIVPKMKGSGSVSSDFRRVAAAHLWPLAMSAVCPLGDVVIKDIG